MVQKFSTPRRLTVIASGLSAAQPDVEEQVMGPSVKVAYKDGEPAPPAHAFARKVGLELSQIQKLSTAKGDYLSATVRKKGRPARDILAELLPKEIGGIYWAKNMYWRKPGEKFVRPVRWLVALLDDQVVPLEFAGVLADRVSAGHRLLAPQPIAIPASSQYRQVMENARVVVDHEERLQFIRKALAAAARTIPGARWREDASLLQTVVNLTEFPSVILGGFDHEFLQLPGEVLVTVMRDHQKYFALEDARGKLLPHFLAVLNIDGDPEGIIRHGHERVLRARFNDARFFWQTDQKYSLRERVQMLKHVTFQKDLGSYYDKTLRVQRLASWLSEVVRQNGMEIRPGVVHKAACLAKTDLTAELVKEFTELQGIVGGLYARAQQLDEDLPETTRFAIADAIYDHYKPQSMEDSAPRTREGALLSIADKADSIAGMFALGLIPSGSKDPFALRRQANGIVRTIAEYKLPLELDRIFSAARAAYHDSEAEERFAAKVDFAGTVRNFFRERLEFYLRDLRGFRYDVVNAVLAAGADDVVDAIARSEAVANVRTSADFESISVAFKRMKNILRQADEKGIAIAPQIDSSKMTKADDVLANAIKEVGERVSDLQKAKNYEASLLEISKLRGPIDTFFDAALVMDPDEGVRNNRLRILQKLVQNFSSIADFSEIVTEGKS